MTSNDLRELQRDVEACALWEGRTLPPLAKVARVVGDYALALHREATP